METPTGITETKEIGVCEVLRAQEVTHTHTLYAHASNMYGLRDDLLDSIVMALTPVIGWRSCLKDIEKWKAQRDDVWKSLQPWP